MSVPEASGRPGPGSDDVDQFDELNPEQWLALVRAEGAVPAELAATPTIARTHAPLAEIIARQRTGRGELAHRGTFIVGVTGGIAAGKTVTAAALQALLVDGRGLAVEVVSTDGFLLPNRELDRRGLTARKGFPESYDHARLVEFVSAVRDGASPVEAPIYDHGAYDVVPDRTRRIEAPDVLVLEGLNVLQPSPSSASAEVPDLLDLAVFVDADLADLRRWFGERLVRLRAEATGDGTSFYDGFATMTDDEFAAMADAVWRSVNEPNVVDHVLPTRGRADLVLEKQPDHSVRRVRVRRSLVGG